MWLYDVVGEFWFGEVVKRIVVFHVSIRWEDWESSSRESFFDCNQILEFTPFVIRFYVKNLLGNNLYSALLIKFRINQGREGKGKVTGREITNGKHFQVQSKRNNNKGSRIDGQKKRGEKKTCTNSQLFWQSYGFSVENPVWEAILDIADIWSDYDSLSLDIEVQEF